MLLLLLKVGKKNEVLFFFSPPPFFLGLMVRCVLDIFERDYKKGKKEIKEKKQTLSPASSNSFERERLFFLDDDDIY